MKKVQLLLFSLLLIQSAFAQQISQNCATISLFSECTRFDNCQWQNNTAKNTCTSFCSQQLYANTCLPQESCQWNNQKPATCSSIPTACPADADSTDCKTDFCNYTAPKCSTIATKCPSFTSQDKCNPNACVWNKDMCIYNTTKDTCSTLAVDQCSDPFCQKGKKCTAKQQQFSKGQVSDVDCSKLTVDECANQAADCVLVDICMANNAGCNTATEEGTCSEGQFATFCSWQVGTCNSNPDFCTKECDTDFCNIDVKSNCQFNSKSTTCQNFGKVQCQSNEFNKFCQYNNIVPGYCSSVINCSMYQESQQSCNQQNQFCYFTLGGICSEVSSSYQIHLAFFSVSAILLAIISFF